MNRFPTCLLRFILSHSLNGFKLRLLHEWPPYGQTEAYLIDIPAQKVRTVSAEPDHAMNRFRNTTRCRDGDLRAHAIEVHDGYIHLTDAHTHEALRRVCWCHQRRENRRLSGDCVKWL